MVWHLLIRFEVELGTSSVMRMTSDLGRANESGLPQVAIRATSQ